MKELRANAKELARHGRFGDDHLIHVSKIEIAGLEALITGGKLPTNPDTGLKEAFFFLPFLAGLAAAAPAAAATTAAPVLASAAGAGLGAAGLGAAGTVASGVGAGMTAGLGALGGASALPVSAALPAAASALPAVGAGALAGPATAGLGALATPAATAPLLGSQAATPLISSAVPSLAASAPVSPLSTVATAAAPKAAAFSAPTIAPTNALATTNLPVASGSAGPAAATAANAAINAPAVAATGAPKAGLGAMFGGIDSSKLMTGLGLLALMKGQGGGKKDKGDKEKDISGIKYAGGDPVFPDESYQGGISPEWDYFPSEHYYKGGGLVRLAGGGPVPGGKTTSADQKLIQETTKALQGLTPNPEPIIAKFVSTFGKQALQALMAQLEQGGPAAQAPTAGLGAISDGMSDSVPAMIDGSQPAALSQGEFVMPADVVSGLGNGSTDAGAQHLQNMVGNVRQQRTGSPDQPPQYSGGGLV